MRQFVLIIIMGLGMVACAGGGGAGDGSRSADPAFDATLIPENTPGFAITVCVHPGWLAGFDAQAFDGLVAYAVGILEGYEVSPGGKVPRDQFDLLTLILHELLHLKGIRNAHIDDEDHGIMHAVQQVGTSQHFLTAADRELLAEAEDRWELLYEGVTDDCDAPIGFRDLEAPAIGKIFYSTDGPFIWLDIRDDWHVIALS